VCSPADKANLVPVVVAVASDGLTGVFPEQTVRGRSILPDGCERGVVVGVVSAWRKPANTPSRPANVRIRKEGGRVLAECPTGIIASQATQSADLSAQPCYVEFDARDNLILDLSDLTGAPVGSLNPFSITFWVWLNVAPLTNTPCGG
jgi:hypothetical protein